MGVAAIPKSALRDNLKTVLASLGDDRLLVTERGRAVAVILTVERWNDLQDVLDELQAQVLVLQRRLDGRSALDQLLHGD